MGLMRSSNAAAYVSDPSASNAVLRRDTTLSEILPIPFEVSWWMSAPASSVKAKSDMSPVSSASSRMLLPYMYMEGEDTRVQIKDAPTLKFRGEVSH